MEHLKILGVDPSLRNTGLSLVTYNTEKAITDPTAFKVSHCQVLVNPPKYTGTEAILNMIDMIKEESQKPCYLQADYVLVESPATMFSKKFPVSTLSSIAHISGAAIALLGIDKGYLYRPNEWMRSRKKEVTHRDTISFLGELDSWAFEKSLKSEKYREHVLDATGLALWWIRENYKNE